MLLIGTALLTMLEICADRLRYRYRAYVEAVNGEKWDSLLGFLAETVVYNGESLNKEGYLALIPVNILYVVADVVVDPDSLQVASRLENLVAGVKQTEHCFYQFTADQVIEKVWTVVVDGEATGSHERQ
jgi:predicted ester cyclase